MLPGQFSVFQGWLKAWSKVNALLRPQSSILCTVEQHVCNVSTVNGNQTWEWKFCTVFSDWWAVLESAPPKRFVITMLARHATMHNDMMIARDSKQQLLVTITTKGQLCSTSKWAVLPIPRLVEGSIEGELLTKATGHHILYSKTTLLLTNNEKFRYYLLLRNFDVLYRVFSKRHT